VNGAFITVQFTVNSSAPAGDYALDLADVQLKSNTTADIADVQVTDGQVKVKVEISQQGIPLAPGWNYFSVPYVLENASVADVLKVVSYDALYEWDSGDDKWTSPVTGIVPLKGYLIKVNSPQTIVNLDPKTGPYVPPAIGINKGWNLIGPTGSASLDAETMLGSIDDSYFNLWGWNATSQRYDTVGINGKQGIISTGPPVTIEGTDVFTMPVGKGFWLWAKEDTTLPAFSP
ncbi:hypothetical protein KKF82_04295, partial [Patescibacteria group bacterium]|nr:hypothetical protein [Patescibacteria group bacterium]